MYREIFRNLGVFGKLILLFFAFFAFSLLGMGLVSLITGNSSDIQVLKINQLLLSLFTMLLPPLICGYLWYEKPLVAFSMHRLPNWKQTILAILLIFAVSPFINLLADINGKMVLPEFMKGLEELFMEMETNANELTKQMLVADTAGQLLFNLLVMAVVPAIVEEVFCRGALLNIFSEKTNKIVSVWIVAIIFSLIHFQMYGFLPRMVYGAILGYLLVWSGSLWLPIFIHFVNNAAIVLASYFGENSALNQTMENLGKAETYGYGIISAVVSIALLWFIYKIFKTDKRAVRN